MRTFNAAIIILIFVYFQLQFNHINSLFIAKGTRWCGVGNSAKNCSDLGELKETDICCRNHDMCPYKFTKKNPTHNGFKWKKFFTYTLSHCECDQKFKNCLNEGPEKKGASNIWQTFKILKIKCFAYLPCDETNENNFRDVWKFIGKRQVGSCFNNYKVVAFNGVEDYSRYLKQHLTDEQKELLKAALQNNLENFVSKKSKPKKYLDCSSVAVNYKQELVAQYSRTYLNMNQTTETSSNDSLNSSNKKVLTFLSNETYYSLQNKSRISVGNNILYRFISLFTRK